MTAELRRIPDAIKHLEWVKYPSGTVRHARVIAHLDWPWYGAGRIDGGGRNAMCGGYRTGAKMVAASEDLPICEFCRHLIEKCIY